MTLIDHILRARRRRAVLTSLRQLDDHMLSDIGFERDRHGRFLGHDFARLQDLGR